MTMARQLQVSDARRDGIPVYQLSIHTPLGFGTLEQARLEQVRNNFADLLAVDLSNQIGIPLETVIVRDIFPNTDLALANEVWLTPALTADDFTTYFNSQVANNRTIGFYGVIDLAPGPQMTELRFQVGQGAAATILRVHVEDMFSLQDPLALFQGVIYKPLDYANVAVYSKEAVAAGEPVILLGFTAEPVGQTIGARPN